MYREFLLFAFQTAFSVICVRCSFSPPNNCEAITEGAIAWTIGELGLIEDAPLHTLCAMEGTVWQLVCKAQ